MSKDTININKELRSHNFSRMRYLSLIIFVFCLYTLITDFSEINPWDESSTYLFKVVDSIFSIIALFSLIYFWFSKNPLSRISDVFLKFVIFCLVIWSILITGIDFSSLSFSTYISVLLLSIAFLYFKPYISVIIIWGSALSLYFILQYTKQLDENFISTIFVLIPIIIIATIISIKSYKEKIAGLLSNFEKEDLYLQLKLAKENLNEEVERQTQYLTTSNKSLSDSQRQLKIEKNRFVKLINNLQTGVFYINLKGEILELNPALVEIMGSPSMEDTKSINIFYYKPLIKFGYAEKLKECISTNKIVYGSGKYRSKWGKHMFLNYYFVPIHEDNNLIGVLASIEDTTENKKAEEDLILAKEKAEESDRLKTAFLNNMSHEIRTPLNAVLGFSELLIRSNRSEKEKVAYSEYIRLNGDSLAKIIDDIVDISKLESKQLKIRSVSFNLHAIFSELHNYYSSVLVQKTKTHIKLETELPDALETDFFIESDKQRLKQILNNLISNAIKYTEKGCITFGYKVVANNIQFFVKDTGYGISSENISQIFDRFFQFSPHYISRQEGTGLGLTISKKLVSLLGGELKVKSEINKGSMFHFKIPLVKSEEPIHDSTKVAIDFKKDLRKYKILIADDEDSNYVLTKRILKPSKVATDSAQNGKHAVEMAANNSYDLILMDIKMPEMDGIEATRQIRQSNKKIPIIIQTAFAMKEIKDEAVAAGCDGFLVKPISLDTFIELVNKHVK